MEEYNITIVVTPNACKKLLELDMSLIGTPDYMGYAPFWHYDYRYDMRSAPASIKKLVHDRLIKKGLSLNGNTKAHSEIIED